MTGPALAITARIDRIRRGEDPQLIARLASGFAILGNQQPEALPGCCMLLPFTEGEPTPAHLDEMSPPARTAFLADFALLGQAVRRATGCERVNYLILCNQVPEVHAHAIPRYAGEDPAKRLMDPFAAYDFGASRRAEPEGRDAGLLGRLRGELGGGSGLGM